MMQRLTPTGRIALLGALAVALLALFWPEEWHPRFFPGDTGDGSNRCPLGFGGGDAAAGGSDYHQHIGMPPKQKLALWWNGTVWTGASEDEVVGALLVDPSGGHVVGAGPLDRMLVLAQAMGRGVQWLDLKGRFLMPGFVDPHVHLLPGGLLLSAANLATADSRKRFQQLIQQHVSKLQQQEANRAARHMDSLNDSLAHDVIKDANGNEQSPTSTTRSDHINGQNSKGIDAEGSRPGAHAAEGVGEDMKGVGCESSDSTDGPLQWLQGGQWDEGRWGGALPDRGWVDAATGAERPALLLRMDGHMAVVNTRALALAGITRHTADPVGGTIDRDSAGEPTGVLRENAIALVARLVPAPSAQELDRALQAATDYALARGVTAVNCMGRSPFSGDLESTWQDLEHVYLPAADAGRLRLRIMAFTPLQSWQRMAAYMAAHGRGHASGRLSWGGVKAFADGSLGSRTALMWEPYETDNTSSHMTETGAMHTSPSITEQKQGNKQQKQSGTQPEHGTRIMGLSELYELTCGADAAGLTVAVHAIGDRAVDEVVQVMKLARLANTLHHNATRDETASNWFKGEWTFSDNLEKGNSHEEHGSQAAVQWEQGEGLGGHSGSRGRVREEAPQNIRDGSAEVKVMSVAQSITDSARGGLDRGDIRAGTGVTCGPDGMCTVPVQGPRHRIEHMQHVSGGTSARVAAQLGVAATPNPLHLVADGELMQQRLGANRAGPGRSHAYRTLAEAGMHIGLATDWPVTDLHPLAGVFAAAFRHDPLTADSAVWGLAEALRVGQALLGHTAHAAYLANMEDYVGTLRSGLRADFIILSSSPLAMQPGRALPDVLQTWVDAACAYGCSA